HVIFSKSGKFAIELNGESFHHPFVIGPKKYQSQLLKQNSLVADGFKVFRWSMNGMKDRERFISEIQSFMGHGLPFIDKSVYKLSRNIITLKSHQLNALDELEKAREAHQSSFLLVLPTGTGKTEIFINDIARLKKKSPDLKVLILVPTRKLRTQTLERLELRLPKIFQNCVSSDVLDNDSGDIFVQTTAFLHYHYYKISPKQFNYIIIDEAHHAVAQGFRRILEHFIPDHLLGVTATPERFDQKSLETIFGEYAPQLSLEDAIRQGLVSPVRCYRVKSNIDLSNVRFNGKEFVKTDLQRTLHVPSRDQLVADVLKRYFGGNFSHKQGIVFCVDIKHAHRMAKLLNNEGINALAVDGRDHKKAVAAQDKYDQGIIRFLCACDLLTEGWDAPVTSILVMARPTFSKVLYTQQIGRGLRNYPGKEALYVIDVVDNYNAALLPISIHSLFRIDKYTPFDNIIDPDRRVEQKEIIVLDGLYEGERRIEPVDIFSFEHKYGSFLNEEQMARQLFVWPGTIKKWLKNKKISADVQYPFGRRKLYFFDPVKAKQISVQMGLKEHT
ncbi:DEAD/DEAH box helicase, partial [bacterium]|nr:DEAD/DEAH box helicase [bacterium]